MHERRGDENARAKVAGAEEEGGVDAESGEFFGDDGERACWLGQFFFLLLFLSFPSFCSSPRGGVK